MGLDLIRRGGRVAAALLVAASTPALAILGFGEANVAVQAADMNSGQPVAKAVVVAAERMEWHEFHSTRSVCARTAIATTGARGDADLRLQGKDPTRLGAEHGYQLFAYRAGYCMGTKSARTRVAGGEVRLKPSQDPPEARLRYLAMMARAAAASCADEGSAWLVPFRDAVQAEAERIAATPLEKFLAIRVGEAFEVMTINGMVAPATVLVGPGGSGQKTLRTALVGAAAQGNVGSMEQMLEWAKADPTLSKAFCPRGSNTCMMPMPDPNMVRRDEPFSIDQRDEKGFSALMAAAKAMKPDAVKWLLEHGADVNVLSGPGGYNALDLVLSRARDDVQENGPDGLEPHLLRMIALLATSPTRPTLHPRYREELADASAWTVGPRLKKFWSEVREQVMAYEARAPFELACPIEQPARLSLELARVR
jgi:hypothetical protein